MADLSRVRALAVKDLREALPNKNVLVPTLIVPLVLCAALPLLAIAGGMAGQSVMKIDAADAQKLFALYEIPAALVTVPDRMLYVFLNHTFVPMFLIMPLMAATTFATHAVVGEKEHRTLETLLQTPLRAGEFVAAKLLGALVPSLVVSAVSFVLYALVAQVGGLAFGRPVQLSAAMWAPVLLLLSPAVSLAGLTVSLIISLRAKTFVEAQQITSVAVVPLVVAMIGATTGRLAMSPSAVVQGGAVLLAVTLVVLWRLVRGIDRERLIRTL